MSRIDRVNALIAQARGAAAYGVESAGPAGSPAVWTCGRSESGMQCDVPCDVDHLEVSIEEQDADGSVKRTLEFLLPDSSGPAARRMRRVEVMCACDGGTLGAQLAQAGQAGTRAFATVRLHRFASCPQHPARIDWEPSHPESGVRRMYGEQTPRIELIRPLTDSERFVRDARVILAMTNTVGVRVPAAAALRAGALPALARAPTTGVGDGLATLVRLYGLAWACVEPRPPAGHVDVSAESCGVRPGPYAVARASVSIALYPEERWALHLGLPWLFTREVKSSRLKSANARGLKGAGFVARDAVSHSKSIRSTNALTGSKDSAGAETVEFRDKHGQVRRREIDLKVESEAVGKSKTSVAIKAYGWQSARGAIGSNAKTVENKVATRPAIERFLGNEQSLLQFEASHNGTTLAASDWTAVVDWYGSVSSAMKRVAHALEALEALAAARVQAGVVVGWSWELKLVRLYLEIEARRSLLRGKPSWSWSRNLLLDVMEGSITGEVGVGAAVGCVARLTGVLYLSFSTPSPVRLTILEQEKGDDDQPFTAKPAAIVVAIQGEFGGKVEATVSDMTAKVVVGVRARLHVEAKCEGKGIFAKVSHDEVEVFLLYQDPGLGLPELECAVPLMDEAVLFERELSLGAT